MNKNTRPTISIYNVHFKIVKFGSAEYKKSVALREEVLLKPLGLFFTPDELELEKNQIHIAGYLGEELCSTAILTPEEDALKMQRVATKSHLQNKGIGSALLMFCEEYAQKHRYKSIYCYSRGPAISFYLKNKFALEGDPFDADGIPHHKMRRFIVSCAGSH
jgi:predicted GNAT family N-acyltransferase